MRGSRYARKTQPLVKKTLLTFLFLVSNASEAKQIQQSTFSYWDKPDIEIFYSIPSAITPKTKILFIMHGASRSGASFIKNWLPLVEGRDVVLIAPQFSKEFYKEYVYLMKTNNKGKPVTDKSLDISDSLGLIFDFYKSKLNLKTNTFRVYGHSGGSQFVHRYLLLSDETRIEKAAMANAGFYTFVDPSISFPFGIKGMNVSDARLEWVLRLKGAILLGDQDIDPKDHFLPSMRKARKQGKHRFERGTNFFNNLINLGVKKNMPFRWRYEVVPNVAHDNAGMSMAAAEFLLEDL
jgi:hypothetical protein